MPTDNWSPGHLFITIMGFNPIAGPIINAAQIGYSIGGGDFSLNNVSGFVGLFFKGGESGGGKGRGGGDEGSLGDAFEEAVGQAADTAYGECANEGQAALVDKYWGDAESLLRSEYGLPGMSNVMNADEYQATEGIWEAAEEAYAEVMIDQGFGEFTQ